MIEMIRCGRCHRNLPVDAFSPSCRTNGAYCRPCAKDYNAKRPPRSSPRAPRRSPTAPESWPRRCRQCGIEFSRWDPYAKPGQAATHCRPCYNAKAAERYRAKTSGRAPAPKRMPREPDPGQKLTGRPWQAVRAQVLAEETHCGICLGLVDKSRKGGRRDLMAPEVDHIVPRVHGGKAYERSNLQLVHRGCNLRAGVKWFRVHRPLVDVGFVA